MHVTKPTRPKEKTQIKDKKQDIIDKLDLLYGKSESEDLYNEIEKVIEKYRGKMKTRLIRKTSLSEEDIILTAFSDSIKESGKPSLDVMYKFTDEYLKNYITYLHLFPLCPYSSRDGFAIIDYYAIKPEFGDWTSIENMSRDFKLIIDAVINHVSSRSTIFQDYINGDENYKDFFIEVKKTKSFDKAKHPENNQLTTKFITNDGEKNIWTTFGEDEIDLNYKNKDTLLMIIDVLLFYVSKGARVLNLLGSNYIWKKKNTDCFALEESQKILQLFRDILDMVSPDILLIMEDTNAINKNGSAGSNKNEENESDKKNSENSDENSNSSSENKESSSSKGQEDDNQSDSKKEDDGKNKKNNASLIMKKSPTAALILNAFVKGSTQKLLKWIGSQEGEDKNKTYINTLYSRNGIELDMASNYMEDEEIEEMILKIRENGGYVSYKIDKSGKQIPYSLNISFFDALSDKQDDDETKIDKFLTAQALLLSLKGIPNLHINDILAARNYYKGVEETGRFEAINKEKFELKNIEQELKDENSIRYKIFNGICYLAKVRSKEKSFSPYASQEILPSTEGVFSAIRTSEDSEESVLILCNVSGEKQNVEMDFKDYGIEDNETLVEMISEENYEIKKGKLKIDLEPYQFMWLK